MKRGLYDSIPLTALGALGLALLALAGCAEPLPPGRRDAAVLYGADDRREVYAHPSALYRALAADAAVAMIAPGLLVEEEGRYSLVGARSLGELLERKYEAPACEDLPFVGQPTASFCSGTLIAPDLVLTAGHCAEDGCPAHRFVLGYGYEGPGVLAALDADDVYSCAEVVVAELDKGGADFAVLRLDRPVVGRLPVQVDDAYRVEAGAPVAAIGTPSGLPVKIDDGGVVTGTRAERDYFVATPDTFAGSSGSGLFDEDGVLIGVLVRGQTDFEVVGGGSSACVAAAVRPPDTKAGEAATYAARALRALCVKAPAEPLCASVGPLEPAVGQGTHSPQKASVGGCSVRNGQPGSLGLASWLSALLLCATLRRRPSPLSRRSPPPT